MDQTDKLAYFLEADQLAGVFADWPDDMNVVLCLEDSGDCEIVVYHRDEGHIVLSRVAGVFGRSVGEFMVVPEMRGYPTRRVMFSEEQKLLSLVADSIDLPETALDYAINYRYAKDQGLNPDTMKPKSSVVAEAAPERPTAQVITPTFRHREPKLPQRVPPEIRAKARRPEGIVPRINLSMGNVAVKNVAAPAPRARPVPTPVAAQAPAPTAAPTPAPSYQPGYAPAAEFLAQPAVAVEAMLIPQGDVLRLVLSRDRLSVNTAPTRVDNVLLREDFTSFMLPRDVLTNWTSGRAAVLDIPLSQFPDPMARQFLASAFEAHVVVNAKGVFVTPGNQLIDTMPANEPRRPVIRRVVTPLRAAMLALVAVGAATGALLSTQQGAEFTGTANGADPEVTRFIGTPLDLIGEMAREDGQ
ncbi:hypothetical protein [Pseudooceanicola sp. MF1-13]|uniref:hypothetical protein n=1 Tax=Pseudooceanicola sp. MF1-13 TaxID=3379095 RepID=UPI0038929C14